MFTNLTPFYPLLIPFLLVLFRVLGLFAFVPMFSNLALPGNVKVLLALAITACVWPVIPKQLPPHTDLIGITLAIISELSVGLLIGMLVSMVFTGIQMGAHLLSQQMGLSMAAIYDPMFDEQSTAIEQIAFWLALVVFFSIGGHRELINTLVHSYNNVPMGQAADVSAMLEVIVGSMSSALHLAVRVGTPGLVAFLLATLAMGFISKSMPQMNLMSMGIGLNILLGLTMIILGMAGWALISSQAWHNLWATFERIFRSAC